MIRRVFVVGVEGMVGVERVEVGHERVEVAVGSPIRCGVRHGLLPLRVLAHRLAQVDFCCAAHRHPLERARSASLIDLDTLCFASKPVIGGARAD